MKSRLIIILLAAVGMSIATGCTTYRKATPLVPVNAQVNFTMEDLEFIGDVEGKATQSYVFGIPYGGRRYHRGILASQLPIGIALPNTRGANNALYDALTQMDNADFVLPISTTIETDVQFLGRRDQITIRCKAYRIKSK